jgi:FAD/FMN-containing dehydrogenase
LWDAKQTELEPACYVEPSNAVEVAVILDVLIKEGCRFAVKSGGLSRDAGQSNVDGGVTIDLGARLNAVELSADKKLVRLGSGALWFDVYRKLEEHDLMVVGGRSGSVGVGGYTLGGAARCLDGHSGPC